MHLCTACAEDVTASKTATEEQLKSAEAALLAADERIKILEKEVTPSACLKHFMLQHVLSMQIKRILSNLLNHQHLTTAVLSVCSVGTYE